MSVLEDALKKALATGKPYLVKCETAKIQESMRVRSYYLKNRVIPEEQRDQIGIAKVNSRGALYIKIFVRPAIELYEFDSSGEVVPIAYDPADDPELQRILALMRKDGKEEEEIQSFTETWIEKIKEKEKEEEKVLEGIINRYKEGV